jgi:hypothetical protein
MRDLTEVFYFVFKLASRIVPIDIRVPRWCLGDSVEGTLLDMAPHAKLVAYAGHLIFVGLSGPGSRDKI